MRLFVREKRLLLCVATFIVASVNVGLADTMPNILARAFLNEDTGDVKIKAEQGDVAAQQRYAELLEGGHRYVEALEWYRKPASAGIPEAQYKMGLLLIRGRPQMSKDRPKLNARPAEAVTWLTKAAAQDHPLAQLRLGQCFQAGEGVRKDQVEAYKWFCLAADNNRVLRAFRDQQALTLSTDQIRDGKERVERFKQGDLATRTTTTIVTGPVAQSVSPVADRDLTKSIKLQGLISSTKSPLAIIQGKSFGIGESGNVTVNGRKIRITCVEIAADSTLITIENHEEPVRLKL